MQTMSRIAPGGGRRHRYVCGTYWNRGASVCANGLMVEMDLADAAVRRLLREEVLRPPVIERALDEALAALNASPIDAAEPPVELERRLGAVEKRLANLAEAVANGGAVPAVLQQLQAHELERRRLLRALEGAKAPPRRRTNTWSRERLCAFLAEWDALLAGNVSDARGLLETALADRIRFMPDPKAREYQLTVPVAFDRVLIATIPEIKRLQDLRAETGDPGGD